MFIHVMLREDRDDDLAAWYRAQADKSQAVRDVLRAAVCNGTQEVTVGDVLDRLPAIVAAAVQDALRDYQFAPTSPHREPEAEDPELAARLDGQLDDWDD